MSSGTGKESRTAVAPAACCGPTAEETGADCPCASAAKGHPVIAFAVIAGVALALVISQVGGILGILAFFRTF